MDVDGLRCAVKRRVDYQLGHDTMSVINQVLKDLDKRGASTNVGEATIRVVHAHSRRSAIFLVAAGAAGMLLLAIIVWLVMRSPQLPPVLSAGATLPGKKVEVLPASQPVAVIAMKPLFKIEGVEPDPLIATGKKQLITLKGNDFKEGATVTLTDGDARVYTKRHIVSLAPEKIEIKFNFGKKGGMWMAEVHNADGNVSPKYVFVVKGAPAETVVVPSKKAHAEPVKSEPVRVVSDTFVAEGVHKQPTQISLKQQADNEFHRAYELMQLGRNSEAQTGFETALRLDAGHEAARKSLVSLLLEKRRNADAEHVLQDGLQNNLQNTGFAILLARLQVERNDLAQALATMQKSLPYAQQQADYQAFVAALLQRQNRHKEAISYYEKAVQLKPDSGVWLMGLGISLRAEQRKDEARDAFKHALETRTLNAELQAYVNQQLKEL